MKFRTWLHRRRIARTIHRTPIFANVAEDMNLNPFGGVEGLFDHDGKQQEGW